MELSVYRQASAFAELADEWNDLLARAPINHIFYTWEWQTTWWQAYQPGELLILTCREAAKLVGIAPLFVSGVPGQRRAQIIGCVDVTDYLDFIVDAAHLESVFACFAEYLADNRSQFERLDLCNIPNESPTRQLLPGLLEARGFSASVEQQEVCPVIELPGDWRGYLSLLDKKQRHEVRRKIRRAQGSERAIDWYIVNGQHNMDEEVAQFIRLMAASDKEKAEFLENCQHRKFFAEIAPLLQDRGWLQMNFLTVDEERAAAYINLVYGDRVMVYNSGLDHSDYGDLSPGIVLLAYNIRHAIEQGYQYYDFLRGSEAYKYRMGGRDTSVMNLRAS